MTPNQIINKYLGDPVEVEDARKEALNQCMDWAFQYVDELGIHHSSIRNMYARQVWTHYDTTQFTRHSSPRNGDLAIWGLKVGFAGHIAVFKEGKSTDFWSADQNWEGVKHVRMVRHNNYGLLGFLRPVKLKGAGQVTEAQAKKLIAENKGLWKALERANYALAGRIRKELTGKLGTDKQRRKYIHYVNPENVYKGVIADVKAGR